MVGEDEDDVDTKSRSCEGFQFQLQLQKCLVKALLQAELKYTLVAWIVVSQIGRESRPICESLNLNQPALQFFTCPFSIPPI